MSDILTPAVIENAYLGMIKIDLKLLWDRSTGVCPDTYNVYKNMREWLRVSNVQHRFHWNNTGQYLPDAIYLDTKSETATYFMLKYGILCK